MAVLILGFYRYWLENNANVPVHCTAVLRMGRFWQLDPRLLGCAERSAECGLA